MSLEELPSPVALEPRAASTVSLADSLRRSGRAVAIAQGASQLLSLAVLAALWRILGKDPFGLMTMVLAVLALVRIVVTWGLDSAAIQQAELTDRQASALFWINQALGLVMTVVVAACAPWMVWFYGKPIGGLTVAMAGTTWVWVLGIQHLALLQRRLRLGTVAWVRLAALGLAGGAAVAAAIAGWGVWSLVVQQYVELLVLAGIAWAIEPWRPQFSLRSSGVGRLVRFGGHCTLSNLMLGLVNSADKILIGRALGEGLLASYSQAFNLMQKPVSVLLTPLTGIMLPGLSRAENPDEYRRLLLVFFRLLGLAMLPVGIGLAVTAPEVIRVLAGDQWADAGPILSVLSLSILVQGFYIALGSVLASAGRADQLSRWSVLNTLVMCGSYFVGIQVGRRFGNPVMGVAWAYTLAMAVVVFPVYLGYTLRAVRVGYFQWLMQMKSSLPAAIAMGAAVFGFRWLMKTCFHWTTLPLLAAEVPLGAIVYVLLAWPDLRWLLHGGLKLANSSHKP